MIPLGRRGRAGAAGPRLLEVGLDVLGEAAVTGRVTVIVVDEDDGALTGDLPSLIARLRDALRRIRGRLEADGKS